MLKDLRAGGEAARSVLKDLFPRAIRLRQDPSGTHLWAEVSEEGMVGLLYDSPEERHAAIAAMFPQLDNVGNSGSGGRFRQL